MDNWEIKGNIINTWYERFNLDRFKELSYSSKKSILIDIINDIEKILGKDAIMELSKRGDING